MMPLHIRAADRVRRTLRLMPKIRNGSHGCKPQLVDTLIAQVASEHNTTVKDILGRSRFREHIDARWDAMRRIRKLEPRPSYPQIGAWFGKHHTSVMHACGGPA